ncbi:MAG: hypothetical protein R3E97_16450 [Candidatus Eisenbacteria bacterium]
MALPPPPPDLTWMGPPAESRDGSPRTEGTAGPGATRGNSGPGVDGPVSDGTGGGNASLRERARQEALADELGGEVPESLDPESTFRSSSRKRAASV